MLDSIQPVFKCDIVLEYMAYLQGVRLSGLVATFVQGGVDGHGVVTQGLHLVDRQVLVVLTANLLLGCKEKRPHTHSVSHSLAIKKVVFFSYHKKVLSGTVGHIYI